MQTSEDIVCEECDAEFSIQYDDAYNSLKACPFCGADLGELEEDDEDDAYIE